MDDAMDEQASARIDSLGSLAGIRVLALEQYQSMPFATNILARLGAEVIKVELPPDGEMSRISTPGLTDALGQYQSGTFLRNNHNKRSVAIDWRIADGREIVGRLIEGSDVFAENFRPGALHKYGLSYAQLSETNERLIYLSISGFGQDSNSPYFSRPAFATVVEAMGGFYSSLDPSSGAPLIAHAGPLGDTISGLYAAIGTLAALRFRETSGRGQHVDVAMMDCMLGIQDFALSQWCLRNEQRSAVGIVNGFRAADGWFVIVINRRHQFEKLAEVIGHSNWATDKNLNSAQDWFDNTEDVIRPGIEKWAEGRSKLQACNELAEAGLAAGPLLSYEELKDDDHVRLRHMLIDSGLQTASGEPFLFPGNPIKLSANPSGPDIPPPLLGADGPSIFAELGLGEERIRALREAGVIAY